MKTDPREDYARGSVPFLDCTIVLDSRPLIPRVETEFWVEKAIAELRARPQAAARVLDLFAGSGAIGIAVLKHLPNTQVDFGEIDARHFPAIEKSLTENGLARERAKLIETDVWSALHERYDAIFANPPYLSAAHTERIQESVLSEEPHLALFAEDDGFALIEKTLAGAAEHLAAGGILFLEHDPEQSARIHADAKRFGLAADTRTDQFGTLRFSVLTVA